MTEWIMAGGKPDREHVKITVHIRKNETGEVRTYADTGMLDGGEFNDFIWAEGNFACDCNRELFFLRANDEPEPDTECGDERYSVNIENPATNEVIYREFD